MCLGLPGALPVLNAAAVDAAIKVALALDARVSQVTAFARKNYFYPDLPKGYQITQFGEPLARDGRLDVRTGEGVRSVGIRQVHLEEDAGKSVHAEVGGGFVSLVDMNRCGVPLVEIVTRPDLRGVDEADGFLTALRRILVHLGVTTGKMHEGSLRFDTNVSLRRPGEETLGTQTEIKNLNSFRSVRRALEFEIRRQAGVLGGGGEVRHETMLWDEASGRAVPMRSKEGLSDYRYFPEPDLVDLTVDRARIDRVREAMPELPEEARARLSAEYALPDYDASVITAEPDTLRLYELVVTAGRGALGESAPADLPKTVANWVMGPLLGYVNSRATTVGDLARAHAESAGSDGADVGREGATEALEPLAGRVADVVVARVRGDVSEPAARTLLDEMLDTGSPVERLIETLGIARVGDEGALAEVVAEVLEASQDEVQRYRAGETKLLRFFVGQVMKRTGGRADPEIAARLITRSIDGGEDD